MLLHVAVNMAIGDACSRVVPTPSSIFRNVEVSNLMNFIDCRRVVDSQPHQAEYRYLCYQEDGKGTDTTDRSVTAIRRRLDARTQRVIFTVDS